MRNYKFATFFVTAYLVIYTLLSQLGASLDVVTLMFCLSPFLVIWMAYSILKYASFEGKELGEDEEWGYSDKSRDQLK
jgi:hypothetical protein